MNRLNPDKPLAKAVAPQWEFFTLYSDSNELIGGRYQSAAEAEKFRDPSRPGIILKILRDHNGDFHTIVAGEWT